MSNTNIRICLLAALLAFFYSCGDLSTIIDKPTTENPDPSNPNPSPAPHPNKPPSDNTSSSFLKGMPDGYEIFQPDGEPQTVFADFNGDGIEDAATMIVGKGKEADEDTRLATIISDNGVAFNKTQMSKNLGDVGTGTELLSVEDNVLSLHHTWMRAVGEYKFRYEKDHGDFRIIGKEYEGFGNAVHDGAGTTSINFLSGKYEHIEKEAITDDEGNVLSYRNVKKTGTVSSKLMSLSDMEEETWYVEWY